MTWERGGCGESEKVEEEEDWKRGLGERKEGGSEKIEEVEGRGRKRR